MLRRRQVAEPNYLEAAYFFVLIPLLSPQGWDYVLLIGLPAYMCLVDRWRDLSPGWRAVALDGLPPHELHDFRPAAAARSTFSLMELVCGQRWCRADCRLPHSLAVAGARMSAAPGLSLRSLTWRRDSGRSPFSR